MVTLKQLFDTLETDIFSGSSTNDFEKKCREREDGLKQYLNILGIMVHQFITEPDTDNSNSYWKQEKIKICFKNLADYTIELVTELNKEKIEDYCKHMSLWSPPFEPDISLLMLNSYYGAIVTDIYWIREITLNEALQISTGKLDLSELGKRTPDKIIRIQEFLNKHKKRLTSYKAHFGTIEEAFKCYKNKYSKAFNLLLLTSIEGLTRNLGAYLIEKQELNVDPYAYNSLDSFLRKIPWKSNLKTSKTHLSFLTNHYTKISYNDPLTVIPNPMEQVDISIKTRLDFLRRRFKENRNLILHGQETEYNKPYYGFINAAALYEVLEAIIECQDSYENK